MMDTSTETKRARLLSLARGGNGRCDPWIEKVTVRRPGEDDRPGFVVHIPPRSGGKEISVSVETLDAAQGLTRALETGGQPANPESTDEAVKLSVPEDHGRIVTAAGEH